MCVVVNLLGMYTWLDLFLELVGNMSIGSLGFWVKFELAIWAREPQKACHVSFFVILLS